MVSGLDSPFISYENILNLHRLPTTDSGSRCDADGMLHQFEVPRKDSGTDGHPDHRDHTKVRVWTPPPIEALNQFFLRRVQSSVAGVQTSIFDWCFPSHLRGGRQSSSRGLLTGWRGRDAPDPLIRGCESRRRRSVRVERVGREVVRLVSAALRVPSCSTTGAVLRRREAERRHQLSAGPRTYVSGPCRYQYTVN